MILIDKDTLIDLYINQNLSTRAIGEKLGCGKTKVRKSLDFHNIKKDETTLIESAKQRRANTCQERYGTNNVFEREETQQKVRKTLIDKYGGLGYQVEELKKKSKDTFNERYSKEQQEEMKNQRIENIKKAYSTGEPQKKILDHCKTGIPQSIAYETRRKNNSFNTSKPEDRAYNKLVEIFGKENIERQYKSDLYPFPCDLYIKSLDTYIELNYYFTHGPEPFDPTNSKHLALLETWKRKSQETNLNGEPKEQFLYAIKKWTQRDPLKRQTAKRNKLNFFEFFNESDFDNWLNSL